MDIIIDKLNDMIIILIVQLGLFAIAGLAIGAQLLCARIGDMIYARFEEHIKKKETDDMGQIIENQFRK